MHGQEASGNGSASIVPPSDNEPMRCPLCAGPLTHQDVDLFTCEVGHALSGAALPRAANARASVALWMAIEALGTEATVLRRLAASDADGAVLEGMADQADEDARLLRELAKAHTADIIDTESALEQ